MRVLVTGGAGFIGSHVCKNLIGRGIDVVAVDCFLDALYPAEPKHQRWSELSQLPGVQLIEHDLREGVPTELFDGVDIVINEAGMPGLMKSWANFPVYSSCNINVVEALATASQQHGVKNFVQISTSSVYGVHAEGNESTPTQPVSPYGVTKLAAEELLRAFDRTFGLPYTVLRYFSVYGPGQRPDMAYNRIIQAVLSGEVIEKYGSGEQSRTNTYVEDCAAATVEAALRPGTGDIFNICGSEEISLNEAIATIEQIVGKAANLKQLPARPGDQFRTRGDATRAQAELGLKQSVSLRDGLSRQVEWQAGRF